jgi:hypothetical protein
MPAKSQKSRISKKTRTPTIELGGPTHTPIESDDDGGTSGASGPRGRASDELNGAQATSEAEGLLGNGKPARELPVSERKGWISILGFAVSVMIRTRKANADVQLPKRLALLFSLPLGLLVIFLLSRPGSSISNITLPTLYNGTHTFHPTTLLISLDGFRPSYLDSHPHLVQNLLALANSTHGLRAESMQPRFPTLTFPNHWSLMTGLYPESHGIVANDFWDPVHRRHFVYTKEEQSWDGDWWWGEPMWSVAQRGGRIAANIMWWV